ncbi:MAG TPA: hypothetical protein VL985_02500 [Stellaceae bacterium]|nr:hypothetical protein [Stellaceae bacterium]
MSEPKGPHHPSHEERMVEAAREDITKAAREEIAEAREEFAEVAREAIDEVVEAAAAAVGLASSPGDGGFAAAGTGGTPPPPGNGGLAATGAGGALPPSSGGTTDPISQIVAREVSALTGTLNAYQLTVLADLLRLHLSLRGPQRLLDNTGNFNRPVFPSAPQTIGR